MHIKNGLLADNLSHNEAAASNYVWFFKICTWKEVLFINHNICLCI